MSVIVDSSFFFSLTYTRDKYHRDCVHLARSLSEQFIIPVAVIPEVAFLLSNRLGHHIMREFIRQLSYSSWQIENLVGGDLDRAGELLNIYRDAKLDFADVTIIAMAERLGVDTILTLDRRDFRLVRPNHIDYFTLLP